MFSETTKAKLEFVQLMIDNIDQIQERHESLEIALNDFEGQPAILMCLMQIGESLIKIKEKEITDKFPVDLAYRMRNIIAHDYLGIDLEIISDTIQHDLQKIKTTISDLLS